MHRPIALVSRLAAMCVAVMFSISTVAAERPPPAELDAEQEAIVEAVEARLNAIEKMAGGFVLHTRSGRFPGRFYIDRPGQRMRLDFDEPLGDIILVRGDTLEFFGGDMALRSDAEGTPLTFLLTDTIRLGGDLRVLQVRERGSGVSIALDQQSRPDEGQIVMRFERNPELMLVDVGTFDADGTYRRIELTDVDFQPFLPDTLFRHQPR